MASIMFNTQSQSSNKENVASKIQSSAKHDVSEQNKSDKQQAMTDGKQGREDSIETEKDKTTQESNNDDDEEDSSGDDLSSSSLDKGEIIKQEKACKNLRKTMM
eukprot:7077692-Ditylum_brightwellii.AAC.1